jgi:hypothetical protein
MKLSSDGRFFLWLGIIALLFFLLFVGAKYHEKNARGKAIMLSYGQIVAPEVMPSEPDVWVGPPKWVKDKHKL